MARTVSASLAVTAVALAACGGPDREDFLRDADRSCQERRDALRDVASGPRADPDGYFRAFARERERQEELEAPDDLQDDWQRYLRLMRDAVALERRQLEVLTDRDPDVRSGDEASALVAQTTRAGARAREQAKRIGLEACAAPPA